jgi:serine/threonine protein kinase
MAKKLRVGDTIRGYRVTKTFGPGAMAISYAAQSPDGRKIFLKQYKSPAPTVIWYGPFVDYQQELAARVRSGKGAHYAVRLVDAFEERWGGPCYFQAYESWSTAATSGRSSRPSTSSIRARASRRCATGDVGAARDVGEGVDGGDRRIHEAKIVHADLKPPNVYLIKDRPSRRASSSSSSTWTSPCWPIAAHRGTAIRATSAPTTTARRST